MKMKVIWFCLRKKRVVGHNYLKQNNGDLVFQTCTIIKMSKFVVGHVTKMGFLKLWITSFQTQNFHLNFKENIEKMMW